MVGCGEEVAEMGMIGYDDMKEQFLNNDDDDEERKMGFLMKSGGWINHGAVLGVLWV
jgi:hypothetical protein